MKARIRVALGSTVAAVTMLAAFIPGVSASFPTVTYSATLLGPSSVVAGTSATFNFQVTNTSTSQIGSIQIALPAGFGSIKAGSASGPGDDTWEEISGACVSGSPSPCPTVLQVDTATLAADRDPLSGGESVTFTVTATAPMQPGTYTFNTSAKPTSDFSGTTVFTLSGSQPSVTVTSAPATALTLTNLPVGGATAGQAFSATVTAVNAWGTATGYAGTVHFTSSDKGAGVVLPADYTFTAADQGSHVFSGAATLTTAGLQSISATDTSNSSISATASVTVHPAAAASLVLSAPASETAGSSIAPSVTAFDAFGNQATGYTGTVAFTSSDHGAQTQLPGAYTFTAGDAGSHAFTAVLTTAGPQTLTATDTGNPSLSSTAGVKVAPAAATALQVSGLPASAVGAGQAFSATVTAVDQYGNIATGYTGTVHFTSTDTSASASLPANYTFTAADAGVHVFSNGFVLIALGAQSITATDVGTPSITASGGVTIKPGPASRIVIVSVSDEGTGLSQPVKGQPFDVAVVTQDAYGNVTPVSQPTTIALSIQAGSGTGSLSGTTSVVFAAGQSSGTIAGAIYSVAENGVVLVVSATSGDSPQPAQTKVNVQNLAASIVGTPGVSTTLSSSTCIDASPAQPTCAITTFQHGVNGKAILSEGACSGVTTGCLTSGNEQSLLMNVSANLKDANGNPLYSRTSPALTIIECDKSLCSGGGKKQYSIFVDVNGTGQFVQAPACPAKGTIAPTGVPFCVDYVSSHRDGSGDTLLYLDFAIDYIFHF